MEYVGEHDFELKIRSEIGIAEEKAEYLESVSGKIDGP